MILSAALFSGFLPAGVPGAVGWSRMAFALDLRPRELLVAGVLRLGADRGYFPSGCRGHGRCQQRLGGADGAGQ